MRRSTVVLTAVLVVAAVFPAIGAAQSGGSLFVSVDDVSVEPGQPMPGEMVTITPTISNSQESSDSYRINAIALRPAGSSEEYTRINDVGTIGPGQTISVPLTVTFEERGTQQLRVRVYGENVSSGENERVSYPLTVTVSGQHPGINVRTDDPVAEVEESASVTVANGLEGTISNVQISVEGSEDVSVSNGETVVASLESGQSSTTNVSYVAEEPGRHELETTLTYTTSGGTVRETTTTTTVTAEPLDDEIELDTSVVGSGNDRGLEVTILNRGNVPAESISLTGTSENASVQRALIERIEPGSSETVRLNLTMSQTRADVSLSAEYDIGSRESNTTTTTTVEAAPGEIDLTGVEVTREGGRVHLTGSAANVGLTDADSVQVSVVETGQVSPASPSKEYFIGTVPPSDFVSFDLYATTSGNATTVPVEVRYLVDGERNVETVEFDAPAAFDEGSQQDVEPESGDGGGGSGLLLPIGIGVVALLVVGGVVARYYFASSDDDL